MAKEPSQKPNEPEKELWTIEDVAAYMRVPVSRVYSLSSRLPRLKVGRSLRFIPGEIREWVRAQKAS